MAALLFSLQAFSQTYYVSVNGSGTQCTNSNPCSLAEAIDKVDDNNGNMTQDIIVYLKDGTYELASPITLSSNHSGTNGHLVIFKPESGANVTISGGKEITGWSNHGNGIGFSRY